jgi:hypothetical protein
MAGVGDNHEMGLDRLDPEGYLRPEADLANGPARGVAFAVVVAREGSYATVLEEQAAAVGAASPGGPRPRSTRQ